MLTVARLIIEAASLRTETRGGHFRTDYPYQDDGRWGRHITCRRDNGVIVSETVPLRQEVAPTI